MRFTQTILNHQTEKRRKNTDCFLTRKWVFEKTNKQTDKKQTKTETKNKTKNKTKQNKQTKQNKHVSKVAILCVRGWGHDGDDGDGDVCGGSVGVLMRCVLRSLGVGCVEGWGWWGLTEEWIWTNGIVYANAHFKHDV